jgi:hypothetical protein
MTMVELKVKVDNFLFFPIQDENCLKNIIDGNYRRKK